MVRTATFLFAAGQETTARLLAAALKHLAEHPELQDELRARQRLAIPAFIEEALRIESPVKADFRLARRDHDARRRGRSRRDAGHAAERRRQPRPPPVRVPGRVPPRPAQRPGPHRLRPRRPFLSRAARWPGPRVGSASSASSTGCATSGCPRNTTGRREPAASGTSRPGSSAASATCTSSSPRPRQPDEPRRRRHRRGSGIGLGVARQFAADGHRVALLDSNREGAEAAAAELGAGGSTALAVECRRRRPGVGSRRIRTGAGRARTGRDPRDQRRRRVLRPRCWRSPRSSGTGSSPST